MLTLRIRQDAGPTAGTYRVQTELDDDGLVQAADTQVTFDLDPQDARDIRWYLEDYLEYPLDPAPRIAARIEGRMAELGRGLFASAFPPGSDARDLWSTVRDRLSEARVEVITDVRHATAIPWELLRDPRTDTPVALRARSFVRGYRQGAQRPRLPRVAPAGSDSADGGSEIRILLVICRPGGRADVPFRSVAGQLVRMYPRVRQVCRLKVLRPATFEALGRELRAAAERGEPYHVVHFDGHGTWADLSDHVLGGGGGGRELNPLRYAARGGPHGYLLFEDPDADDNVEYVDGIRLGTLLAETQVPLLVLNACRSAHAEVADTPAEAEAEEQSTAPAGERPAPVDDPHARVRAYGSLAQEIVDAGVAGVVAMRYNVYVVTATQFIAEMYQNLLNGSELGQAVTRGRKNLADNPMREIAFERVSLQDWPVPVVYEVAPLRLFSPSARPLTLDGLLPGDTGKAPRRDSLPAAPDTGFYGRDETLLAIDRALDTNQIVLLHAFAGSGKTTTAVEFARWYQATGGLDDPETGEGAVVFSSFELHRPLSSVLNDLWEALARRLPPGESDRWMGLSLAERRELALRLLDLLPVLWIWDNVEPVTGFPAGTPSAWSDGEIAELAGFLRDLRRTKAKILLTSRREEQDLLGGLPTRISLRPLTMPDRFQLARAVADRSGKRMTVLADWRPLLRFSDGNPLTLTVLVREALRSGVRSASDVERFVERVRSGAGDIEDDESQGRSRSLGASLSYGVAAAFSPRERAVLAMLHLFQRVVEGRWLKAMLRDIGQSPAGDVFTGLAEDDVDRVLGKAAEVGLLAQVSSNIFMIHPALPWYFQRLFAGVFGLAESAAAMAVTAAYIDTVAAAAGFYDGMTFSASGQRMLPLAGAHEANFLNARALAISDGRLLEAGRIMHPLQFVYESTARDSELARLADEFAPLIVDQATGLPPEALEFTFLKITEIRARAARRAGKLDDAERLIRLSLKVSERRAEAARALPPAERKDSVIASLGVDYMQLGLLLLDARRTDCVGYFEKALAVYQETNSRGIAQVAGNLATVYQVIPELRDLDRADKWLSMAIEHYKDDPTGQGKCLAQRGSVKTTQARELIRADGDRNTVRRLVQEAADALNGAFSLLENSPRDLVTAHEYAGRLYQLIGQHDQAIAQYMLSLKLADQHGQQSATVGTKIAAAETLALTGRFADAALFAEQAVQDAQRFGMGFREEIAKNLLEQIRTAQGSS